jgi:hypothetical protein
LTGEDVLPDFTLAVADVFVELKLDSDQVEA